MILRHLLRHSKHKYPCNNTLKALSLLVWSKIIKQASSKYTPTTKG